MGTRKSNDEQNQIQAWVYRRDAMFYSASMLNSAPFGTLPFNHGLKG
jgi:hypothetical protein